MGKSRLILAINGILMVLLGVAFWGDPEFFTLAMFPEIAGNETALKAATALGKNMGAGCVFIGGTIFMCKAAQDRQLKNLHFHVHSVFLLLVAALIEVRISNGALVPLPIIAFFAVLGLASLFVASRRFQS